MDAVPPPRTRYCSRCLTTFPGDADRCPNLACRSVRPAAGWSELLDPGSMIDRTYRVAQRLAIGGAGVTYLGHEVDDHGGEVGPPLAIKVLYQQRDSGPYLRRLQTEAQILQGLNHAQIVECRGFVHRSGHSPYLVTRYMGGGSLLDHLRRVGSLPPHVVAGVARQICWALDVAHRQGVIHRDLKPENVLLEEAVARDVVPQVRVADFGIAKVYGSVGDRLTRVGAFVGTPQYAAPEQFEGIAPEPATDIYALGAVMLFCLTLRPVADFMAELDPDAQREHLVKHLPPKLPELPQPERGRFETILARAMAVDAGDRCGISQLERDLASFGNSGQHASLEVLAPPPEVHQTITAPPSRLGDEEPVVQVPEPPEKGGIKSFVDPASSGQHPVRTPLPTGSAWAPRTTEPSRDADATFPPLDDGPISPTATTEPRPLASGLETLPPEEPDAGPSKLVVGAVALAVAVAGAVALASGGDDDEAKARAKVPEPPKAPATPSSPPAVPPSASGAPRPSAPAKGGAPATASPPRPPPPRVPDPEPPKRSSVWALGGLVLVLGTLVGGAVLAAAGWFVTHPGGTDRVTIVPGTQAWNEIAAKVARQAMAAERRCSAPPAQAIILDLDPSGSVDHLELPDASDEQLRACMESTLSTYSYPSSQGTPARIAMKLER